MMLYRVLKLVRFTVKKEVGKVVETLGEPGEELMSFEKLGQEPRRLKRGQKRAQNIFKIFNFENVETFRNSCV